MKTNFKKKEQKSCCLSDNSLTNVLYLFVNPLLPLYVHYASKNWPLQLINGRALGNSAKIWNTITPIDAWPRVKFVSKTSLTMNSRPMAKLIAVENPKTNTILIVSELSWLTSSEGRWWALTTFQAGNEPQRSGNHRTHMTKRTINQF